MQEHYGAVKAGQQAGAVTYFAFLSFFPILALAFSVVGLDREGLPDAAETTSSTRSTVLPGLVGEGERPDLARRHPRTPHAAIRRSASWSCSTPASAGCPRMRGALIVVFELPSASSRTSSIGKLRDLMTLVVSAWCCC